MTLEESAETLAQRPATPFAGRWRVRLPAGRDLELGGRPRVMGVLNLTPDSFSDGGLWLDPDQAVARGLAMLEEGAEILDLGAESTRPGGGVYGAGAAEVPADDELRRLLPVLEALREATPAVISVDTRKGAVAARALAAGADLINDISALGDPALAEAVAASGCPVVLMHRRGEIPEMQRFARYLDVVGEVRSELAETLSRAHEAGIDQEQVILDPGLGFAKGAEHNLALLRDLGSLASLGRPLLVGASRKSFIGRLTGEPPEGRLAGSLAAAAWATLQGAAVLRVHDVAETVRFLAVWHAIESPEGSP